MDKMSKCGFRTANSVYYVDLGLQLISGGKLGYERWYKYNDIYAVVGYKASVNLADGRQLLTGVVQAYIE